jgi:hypothetical protein
MADTRDRALVEPETLLLVEREREHLAAHPERMWPPLQPGHVVNMLVVTDGVGGFSDEPFGLQTFMEALHYASIPWVSFRIRTAHRGNYRAANMRQFRFDSVDLPQFDVIWLFGVNRKRTPVPPWGIEPPLSQAELRALSQYMDGGGGVFATGDHEDLGAALCGSVPRVRSMRKWHWGHRPPEGEPMAPPQSGPNRVDTLREGSSQGFTRDDQSDDVPQVIAPRMYPRWSFPEKSLAPTRFPHPVLCGPRGTIRQLPDHMHEGECYVPGDLNAGFTFDGYTTEEYPPLQGSGRVAPQIIAWSWIVGGRPDGGDGPVNSRTFPAIAVWDGHRVQRGRVLTEATFHHFFNVNLVGDYRLNDPVKQLGFRTPAGRAVLEDIKSYFCNIAVWLARPQRQVGMRTNALWACRWDHRVAMDLRPEYMEGLENLDLEELLRIGDISREVLTRLASPCQARIWIDDIIRELLPKQWDAVESLLDPWSLEPETAPDPMPWLYADTLAHATLGGAIYALAEQFPEPDPEILAKVADLDWNALLRTGTEVAERRMNETIERWGRGLSEFAKRII